jgi:hypothetical protein
VIHYLADAAAFARDVLAGIAAIWAERRLTPWLAAMCRAARARLRQPAALPQQRRSLPGLTARYVPARPADPFTGAA